jgi:hypothetical protein
VVQHFYHAALPHKESKMKSIKFLALLLALCVSAAAQITPLSQQFTETVTLAPPAINNAQTYSNTTGTGVSMVSTGGSIAAGTYRVSVTLFTATNTETPQSVDSTTSSTVTCSTGTCTLIIQPPNTQGAGANVVGWRMGVSANGGATATETLQTITNLVCTSSASSTPSCALTSPATFTVSTNFSAGSGIGPATPGTAIFPQLANQANQALFENSQYQYHAIYWVVTGTAPSACTFNLQTGATIAALANVGQTITCTASGAYAFPSNAVSAYSAFNLATYTPGNTTTSVAFYETVLPFNPAGGYYFGNAAPTGTCLVGTAFQNLVGTVSITLYTCNAGAWTAVTVP